MFEQTNLLAIYLMNYRFTYRRIYYILCHAILILEMIYGCAYVPLVLLVASHTYDIFKDILLLLFKSTTITKIIYKLKAFYLVGLYITHLKYCDSINLIIPGLMVLLSLYDSLI